MISPFFSDGFRSDKDGNIWTSAGKAVKCLIQIMN